MADNSVGYIIVGVAIVSVFAMLASLCGMLVVWPLLRRASRVHGVVHIALIDWEFILI